jgi:hypothetical protein
MPQEPVDSGESTDPSWDIAVLLLMGGRLRRVWYLRASGDGQSQEHGSPSEFEMTSEILDIAMTGTMSHHTMPRKIPCLCRPTCKRILSSAQRYRHRKLLKIALDTQDGSSSDAKSAPDPNEISQDLTQDPSHDFPPDFPNNTADTHDFDNLVYSENESMDIGSASDDSDAQLPSDNSHDTAASTDADRTDDLESDDLTPADLVRILEERFGDEWQQQLHDIRMISLPYFCDQLTSVSL